MSRPEARWSRPARSGHRRMTATRPASIDRRARQRHEADLILILLARDSSRGHPAPRSSSLKSSQALVDDNPPARRRAVCEDRPLAPQAQDAGRPLLLGGEVSATCFFAETTRPSTTAFWPSCKIMTWALRRRPHLTPVRTIPTALRTPRAQGALPRRREVPRGFDEDRELKRGTSDRHRRRALSSFRCRLGVSSRASKHERVLTSASKPHRAEISR